MTAADLLVQCLLAEGVRVIFGLPGEENEDLLFALEHSSIRFIPTRHEQGAAFMADVYGRLTGKAGVCLATLGPGATNLITGVADAQLDKSPVVAITAQGGLQRLHKESHQLIDIVEMFRPITKWNSSIINPATIPEIVRKAFKVAQEEKPGATHIELPEDVAGMETTGSPLIVRRVRRAAPDHKALEAAALCIANAQRPIFLAGNGAIRKLAATHLRALALDLNIPVVATPMGKGAIADDATHALFTIGAPGTHHAHAAIAASDLVIAVGYDVAEYAPSRWNTDGKKPIVHIDFASAEVDASYDPEVEIVADIGSSLWGLRERLNGTVVAKDSWYASYRTAIEKEHEAIVERRGSGISVPQALRAIRRALARDGIIISDVGAHKMWIGRMFPVYEPGTCIISNGLASMGIALPGGIAARLAYPDRQIVAVNGDGGFLMNAQELETATRIGAGFTTIILNDNNYGLITWKQEQSAGKSFGTALTNPDFVKFAESFGIRAHHPTTEDELETVLREALPSKEMRVVVVDIDASANALLAAK